MSILRRAIKLIAISPSKHALTEKDLVRMESKIGAKLFGPILPGHKREFFCLDAHTWVWYESATNPATGETSAITTRYEIRGDRIVKIQDGQPNTYTSLEESRNLVAAMKQYRKLTEQYIYAQATTA